MYQLVNSIVSPDGAKAIVFGVNINNNITSATLLDISTEKALVKEQKTFNKFFKMVWPENDAWCYIEKDGSNWDSKVTKVKCSWNFDELETEVLNMELFDYVSIASPSVEYLAFGTFKGNKVKVFSTANLQEIGSLNVENSFYPKGINFSNDSQKLGYVALDQGSGSLVYAENKGGNFVEVLDTGTNQLRDDYQTTAAVIFEGDDIIVTTIYCGQDFEIVKYNKKGDVIWELKLEVAVPGLTDEEEIDNIIWDQQCHSALIDGKLYLGAGKKVLVIDTEKGEQISEIATSLEGFIHQIMPIPNSKKLFATDVFGSFLIINI